MNAALLAIPAGIIAGLTALPGHVGPAWFILIAFAGVAVFLAALLVCSLYPFHQDRDSTSDDADTHMAPLRAPAMASGRLFSDEPYPLTDTGVMKKYGPGDAT